MYLTGREIKDLAEYVGFTVTDIEEDALEQEFSVDNCPKEGVLCDDKGVLYFDHVVTCDGCDANECTPLGEPLNV